MFRSLNNKRCLFLLSALTAALLWLAPARSVRAAVYTYNARQRTINAGVLFVGSAADNTAPDPAPYVFFVLDNRPDVKPVGWTFVNPLAQSTVTTAMSTRWRPSYKVGDSITPSMAAYWEVALRDVSADDLQQFDVLYLSASGQPFLPSDNEKLRRFVDNGGQLIVEYGAAGSTLPFFDSANWTAGSTPSALLPPLASAGVYDLHSLLTQPNFLQSTDLGFLGAPSAVGNFGTIAEASSIFSQVLQQNGLGGVDAAQLGGGQIITSALNLGPTVSISFGAFFSSAPFFTQAPYYLIAATSYNVSVVPAVDLQLLSNILSWADTHPTENKTSHQNASGPSAASYTAAWAYPDPARNTPLTGTVAPPGVAVSGDYVYVVDSTGVLHAFDAIPDEALTSSNTSTPFDDGSILDFGSTTNPTPYDELWHASVGANASGPTVASFQGKTYVFVEKANGSVVQYDNVTGAVIRTLTPPNSAGSYGVPINAPTPTYYDGRIYAGQADGTLFAYSLNGQGSAGGGALIPVDPQVNLQEYVTASPAVGLLASGTVTNSVVAYVPTSQNMNTVLLGARNDPLINFALNGQFLGYNVNRNARYSMPNLFVDTTSVPAGRAYDSSGQTLAFATTGPGQDPVFSPNPLIQSTNIDDQFGDWDIDLLKSIPQNSGMTLTLHEIKALSLSNTSTVTQATLSAPAIDRKGDYYYTVNDGTYSYLFGVHDDIAQRNVQIKFRFRLPTSIKPNNDAEVYADPVTQAYWNFTDRDNVNYNNTTTNADLSSRSLLEYKFVGAPVVDGQGNVYVAAQNPNKTNVAAVLCFSADQEVTAEPPFPTPNGFDATQSRYFQPDEDVTSGHPQNPLVAIPQTGRGAGRYGQITTAGTLASVFNFGRGSGGSRQIAGNLTEPQPFTAVPNAVANVASTATWMYFHTNLAWYATFAVSGKISGLSKAGNTLLLCDSGSPNFLYKMTATPTVAVGKLAALTVHKSPLGTGPTGGGLSIGTVSAAPSAGGGAMVINGTAGLAAFNQQLTLIADNNRILEADADGNAVWSADATTRVGANGLSTKVDFAHPSALAQFAPNDYLVADTGNNRCVRFDRGGNVIWELTRFNDPLGLMAPGQPNALAQPSSVEVRSEVFTYKDTNNVTLTGKKYHYLVADTGSDRLVEVTDTVGPTGQVLSVDAAGNVVASTATGAIYGDHVLTWVTHTGDKFGRHYHYAGASYLVIPGATPTVRIFALVTNTRIAQLVVNGPLVALAPASADAPGGSIVAFSRPASPPAFNTITTQNDLVYVATSFLSGTGTNAATFQVRNPHYLHVYAPPQANPVKPEDYAYSFLYADDSGAFDLVYQGQNPPVSYGLAFTTANYRLMTTPADFLLNKPLRAGLPATAGSPAIPAIPFVPTCVQRINDDDTNSPVASHIERYLITQSYSQGELARLPGSALPNRLGGEIFEVDVSTVISGTSAIANQYPVGGFAGAVTLSHPVGTSPLTQPTFAIRTTQ